jgi:hypothetical protein
MTDHSEYELEPYGVRPDKHSITRLRLRGMVFEDGRADDRKVEDGPSPRADAASKIDYQ